jgi:iron complex outermembrane recepter protein
MKRHHPRLAEASTVRPFALKLTVATLAAAGVLTTASVWAQQVDSANVVTVSGVRAAAQSALTIKRDAEQVMDSIVADDIGKFPDKNVAEILSRVPGVQVVRGGGEASRVVVRGLGSVVTLLNGREMFTAAGRNLVLSDIPASMLKRVDVIKSQGPDMVEGGTAGVIDVRTYRPFDFKGSQTVLNARAENRDKSGATDPNVSALVSNRWTTDMGQIGALVNLSYQRGRYHDEVAWVSPPVVVDQKTGAIGGDTNGRVMGEGDRKRLAANFALQWRPNKDMEFFAEGFSTKIDHDSQSIFFLGGLPVNDPRNVVTTIPGTKYLDTLTNPGADNFTLSSTQARRDDSEGHQGAIGGRWNVAPTVKLSTELARTVSTYRQENPILDVVRPGAKAVVAKVRDGGGYIDYPGTDMLDPGKWKLFGFFDNFNRASGTSTDWRTDVSWDVDTGILKNVDAGFRVARRYATYGNELDGYTALPGFDPVLGKAASGMPGLTCASPETSGDYGINQYYAPCYKYMLDHTAEVRKFVTGATSPRPENPSSVYTDHENTSAIYVSGKLGFDIGSVPVDGQVGVRAVKTRQTIDGFSATYPAVGPVSYAPISVSSSSTDILPSVALRAKLQPDLYARVVYGKAIERAAFASYNPGLQLRAATPNVPGGGSAGNPNLKPQESKNLDLSLEWYFAPSASISGTYFDHRFTNYLANDTKAETYNGVSYLITRPYNASSAKLTGFEGSYQQFYTMLPGWMSGLGLQANFTYTKGGMEGLDGKQTETLPGMSKFSYNIVGLYEQGPWTARVAYTWRDKFVDTYNYRNLNPSFDLIVAPIKTLDASLSYKINENMTVTLDGVNLANSTYHDYHGVPEAPRDIRRYDRAIGVALRWKM